jgi:hypothetical protein
LLLRVTLPPTYPLSVETPGSHLTLKFCPFMKPTILKEVSNRWKPIESIWHFWMKCNY